MSHMLHVYDNWAKSYMCNHIRAISTKFKYMYMNISQSYMCNHICAIIYVQSYMCNHTQHRIRVLDYSHICVIIYVLSYFAMKICHININMFCGGNWFTHIIRVNVNNPVSLSSKNSNVQFNNKKECAYNACIIYLACLVVVGRSRVRCVGQQTNNVSLDRIRNVLTWTGTSWLCGFHV